MEKDLVEVTLKQNRLGDVATLTVWVRPQDKSNFDYMWKRNVDAVAEEKAKELAISFVHQAVKNGLEFLYNLNPKK